MALGISICQGTGVPMASLISFKYSRESSLHTQVRLIFTSCSKRAWQLLSNGGGSRKEEREERNGEEMQPVSDI